MSKTSNFCGTSNEKEAVWSAVRHHTEEKFFPHPRSEGGRHAFWLPVWCNFASQSDKNSLLHRSSCSGQIQTEYLAVIMILDGIGGRCLKDVSLPPFLWYTERLTSPSLRIVYRKVIAVLFESSRCYKGPSINHVRIFFGLLNPPFSFLGSCNISYFSSASPLPHAQRN